MSCKLKYDIQDDYYKVGSVQLFSREDDDAENEQNEGGSSSEVDKESIASVHRKRKNSDECNELIFYKSPHFRRSFGIADRGLSIVHLRTNPTLFFIFTDVFVLHNVVELFGHVETD